MAGLHILKNAENLSDEQMIERYERDLYYQYFCEEVYFRRNAPLNRSSMSRWRRRMGERRIAAPLRESIRVACRMKAAKSSGFRGATVDTTVQPKNIAYPTDAGLMYKALSVLAGKAGAAGVALRQTHDRTGREACWKASRRGKDSQKALEQLGTCLGRVIRDVRRWIQGRDDLLSAFEYILTVAERVMTQQPRDGLGPHVYALHALEVECIAKGKVGTPYEFGVLISLATTIIRPAGGQFVTDVRCLPGRPYDGHTLLQVLPEIERNTGGELPRILVDQGHRGHNAREKYRDRIFPARQRRGVTPAIREEMKRRNAVEPVIGHVKKDHRMGRNYLAHAQGDAINAVLAAVGYNFHLLFRWARSKLFRRSGIADDLCAASCPA